MDEVKYSCFECSFHMCESCFMNEEDHEHPLEEQRVSNQGKKSTGWI